MRELKEVKILIISGPWDQQLIQGGVEMVWEMTKSCASLSLSTNMQFKSMCMSHVQVILEIFFFIKYNKI